MTVTDISAIASLIISFGAFAYTYSSNTKKYELKYQYRCEVLKWYDNTINILSRLNHECKNGWRDEALKTEMLSKLSAEIEIGRFYFPNVDKGDGFGNEKPFAYRAYRNLMLDFLVYSYDLYKKENAPKYINHANILQRHFTSLLVEILDPKEFLKETKKLTKKTFIKELHFEHFINHRPEIIEEYI